MNIKQKEMQARLEQIKNKKNNFPAQNGGAASAIKATKQSQKTNQVVNRGRSGSN